MNSSGVFQENFLGCSEDGVKKLLRNLSNNRHDVLLEPFLRDDRNVTAVGRTGNVTAVGRAGNVTGVGRTGKSSHV